HTSGTIGAMGNNGIGVAGVNWNVRIMPLKFLDGGGWGTTDDAIEAVLYAAWFGVPITSNSWGGGRKSRALEVAISDSAALFVASAGNSGNSRKQYPAAYVLDNVLSVAATDHDDQLASFSNYGASWVDLAAPGVAVLSTTPNDEYDWGDGTSMAAPHVAGVAGQVLAQEPGWTWVEIKDRILTSVDPLDSLAGLVMTGGRLNAATAVGAPTEPPDPDVTPPSAVSDLSATSHDTVTLIWTAPGDDGDSGTATLYDVRYATSLIDDSSFDTATAAEGEPPPHPAGTAETFAVTGLAYETTYYFALKTIDEAGNASGLSNLVSATTGLAPPPEFPCDDGIDNDLDGDVDCADLDCVVAGPPCETCGNNVCEVGENCGSCPEDCSIPVEAGFCGDGVCQSWDGEDCESCTEDCNGTLTGKPSNRFCCGGGQYGVDCADSPGVDPELFVISFYYDGAGPYDDLTTLGAGSTYTIHNAPGGWYGYPDIAECQVNCFNEMRAYNHDSVSADGPGEYGGLVSLDTCLANRSDENCCSTAIDQGLPGYEYSARCCFIP
ncbi:MAG: S8 family serine peptidase, partial [Planctomycetota bacterium]